MSLYVSTEAPMSLSASSDGTSLGLGRGARGEGRCVETSPDYAISTAATESLFADLMPLYLPEITGALGDVPLPASAGLGSQACRPQWPEKATPHSSALRRAD